MSPFYRRIHSPTQLDVNLATGYVCASKLSAASKLPLEKKVAKVEKNGRVYRGYTPAAVDVFYAQLKQAGAVLEKNPIHDRIVGHIVFILTNSEKNLTAALDAEDQVN
jgi:hypothetical protein